MGVEVRASKSLHRPGLTPPFGLRRAKVVFWKPTPPRQKLYVLEEKGLRGTQAVKSFLESPYSLSKNFMWEREGLRRAFFIFL